MKSEEKDNGDAAVPLTLHTLKELKSQGFQYVQVNGFSHGKCLDYMEPSYFLLSPLKQLSEGREQKGIYEPIDSQILKEWASFPDEGIKVFVAKG
jgi:hypothetical protein